MARFVGYFGNSDALDAIRCGLSRDARADAWQFVTFGPLTLAYDPKYTTFVRQDDVFALLGGALLLPNSPSHRGDAERVCQLIAGEPEVGEVAAMLRGCRGNFTLVFGRCDGVGGVKLATDCLGTRPLYLWRDEAGAGFAGQHSLVWRCGRLDPRAWDRQGLVERIIFNNPLGERTDHPSVTAMNYASLATVDGADGSIRRYRRWRQAAAEPGDPRDRAAAIYDAFSSAVAVRARRFGARDCLLSGGMDSRLIGVELRRQGERPTFHNHGHEKTLDSAIARRLAAAWDAPLNVRSIEAKYSYNIGGPSIRSMLVHDNYPEDADNVLPIWSGDAGSLCLGGIYLDPSLLEMTDRPRADQLRQFVATNPFYMPPVLVPRDQAPPDIDAMVDRRIAEDGCPDVLSGMLHLMMADHQRHNLWPLHNAIERYNIENVTPFLDPEVLAAADACPVEQIMLHRVYAAMYELLPDEALVTGWQTYPGHVPCPIPLDLQGVYQWDPARGYLAADRAAIRQRCNTVLRALKSPSWPREVLSRRGSAAFAVLVRFGLLRYEYVVGRAFRAIDVLAERERLTAPVR